MNEGMKKSILVMIVAGVLMSSCGTYSGQGAYAGATIGSVLGSAIGGISGGWRGRDIGTIVGMTSGAVVGAAVGSAADQQRARDMEEYRRDREARYEQRQNRGGYDQPRDESGFDATNSGDDRIDFDGAGPKDGKGGYTAAKPRTFDPTKETFDPAYSVKFNSLIQIRNARLVDANEDGVLKAGEECKVTFEIMNRSPKTLYDVQPTVFDVTGNKHIHISPNLHIESIAPNSGVRYTATILADKRLKNGEAVIRVGVTQGNKEITSQIKEFTVQTRRR